MPTYRRNRGEEGPPGGDFACDDPCAAGWPALAAFGCGDGAAPAGGRSAGVRRGPAVLRAGTTQTVQGLNPLERRRRRRLRDLDPQLRHPRRVRPGRRAGPGLRRVLDPSADGLTWTFKIRPGMKWSDGQPATSEDARWTMQYVLDATTAGRTLGLGYLDPYQTAAGVTAVTAPDPRPLVVTTNLEQPAPAQSYIPILPKHIWSKLDPKTASSTLPEPGADRRHRPVPGRRVQAGPVRPAPAQPELLGPAGRRGPDRHHHLQEQRHDDPGAQEGRARLRPGRAGRPSSTSSRPTPAVRS